MKIEVFNKLCEGLGLRAYSYESKQTSPFQSVVLLDIYDIGFFFVGCGDSEEDALSDAVNDALKDEKFYLEAEQTVIDTLEQNFPVEEE